jgi:hypothetical protein
MMRLNFLSIFALSILIFSACEKQSDPDDFTVDYLQEYFPAQSDIRLVYQVDSMLFKRGISGLEIDTLSYTMETSLVDSVDLPNGLSYIWEKKYQSLNDPLNVHYHITSRMISEHRAIVQEDNLSFISLVFPPNEQNRWDGLSLINADSVVYTVLGETIRPFKDWNQFRILETDGVYTYGDRTFEDVVTVLQTDTENAIEKRYSIERFAKAYGLIYKEMWILDTQNISDQPWVEKAERGFILKQSYMRKI